MFRPYAYVPVPDSRYRAGSGRVEAIGALVRLPFMDGLTAGWSLAGCSPPTWSWAARGPSPAAGQAVGSGRCGLRDRPPADMIPVPGPGRAGGGGGDPSRGGGRGWG